MTERGSDDEDEDDDWEPEETQRMKKLAAVFAGMVSLLHAKPAPAVPLDFLRLIKCVAMIEDAPIGFVSTSGARGKYQLREATWYQYSQHPHEWASEFNRLAQIETQRVALAHCHWIVEKAIPALGLPVTAYSVGLLWFGGFGRIAKMNLSRENVDFAKRFEALYEDVTW